jgi:hypothetical protein
VQRVVRVKGVKGRGIKGGVGGSAMNRCAMNTYEHAVLSEKLAEI